MRGRLLGDEGVREELRAVAAIAVPIIVTNALLMLLQVSEPLPMETLFWTTECAGIRMAPSPKPSTM